MYRVVIFVTNSLEDERLTCVPRLREVWGLQMIRHRFNIYAISCVVLAWRYVAEMGTAKAVFYREWSWA